MVKQIKRVMKELTIKEKAKAYDEALETARKINSGEGVAAPPGWTTCEVIFPELTENEDEKIRKDIIVLVKDWWDRVNKDNISTKEQMIAWLEKQGEIVDYYEDKLDECACKYFNKGYKQALEKQGKQEFNCDKLETFVKGWRDKYFYPDDIDKFIGFAKSVIKWYQQNEQETFDYEKAHIQQNDFAPKSALEALKGEKVDNANKVEQKPDEEYNITGISSNKSQGKLGEMIKNLKSVWGEEDENYHRICLDLCTGMPNGGVYAPYIKDEAINWLKSIKDRVQSQNRWKESLATADLENSLCAIQDGFSDTSCEYKILGEAIEFIRCTEPKSQWKPSGEQMEFVWKYAEQNNYDGKVFTRLYNDLKKLKGE